MTNSIIQYVLYLVILVALAIPLGGLHSKGYERRGSMAWQNYLPGGESHLQDP